MNGNVAALILAAGVGRRMGGRPKALLRLGGETFVERVARTAREAGLEPVIVVSGAAALPEIEGVRVVENRAPEGGMISSIRAALRALVEPAAGALVWPVDCPRVPAAVVRAVADEGRAGAAIVIPRHSGRRGHPAFFAARLFAELLAAPDAEGARAVVRAHPAEVRDLDVAAPEVLDDVDTPEEYARLSGGRPDLPKRQV